MSATTTEITYFVSPDSFDSADPAFNDIPASLEAYADQVDAALTAAYPDAKITVEVAFGTSSAYAGDNDISEDVERIAAQVYQRDEFWQEPSLGK